MDARSAQLRVAVNVPAELVAQHDLPDLVENALKLWGREQVQLAIEITERSLVAIPEHSFGILSRIRELGVKVSIDDFGTGYSCLAYFRNIPADELKIDKSFVAGLLDDPACAEITSVIIDLAHRFGLSVVGEGVEDEATWRRCAQRNCDVAQGYLLRQADDHEAVPALARRARPGAAAGGGGLGAPSRYNSGFASRAGPSWTSTSPKSSC